MFKCYGENRRSGVDFLVILMADDMAILYVNMFLPKVFERESFTASLIYSMCMYTSRGEESYSCVSIHSDCWRYVHKFRPLEVSGVIGLSGVS